MGDCLQTGKPSRYVNNHLGQLSLPSLQCRQIEYRPVWLGLRQQGVLTYDGWKVKLCVPIRQVAFRCFKMEFMKSYTLTLNVRLTRVNAQWLTQPIFPWP